MNSLSILLKEIRIKGSIHFNACFQSPWGLSIQSSTVASFHLVAKGQCWLSVKGIDTPISVQSGDAVIFPQGTEHQLYDSEPSNCIPASLAVKAIKEGENPFDGESAHFNIICGYFNFERNVKHIFVYP